jgi:hypothetical protein
LGDAGTTSREEARLPAISRYRKTRNKTKIKLPKDLRQPGYDTTKEQYLEANMLVLCWQQNVLIIIKKCQVKEGRLRKPKGIAWLD